MFKGKTVLHIGSGKLGLPIWFSGCAETRIDIDSEHEPDIIADMRYLDGVGNYDVIYVPHALEHLYPHEVLPTLKGFKSILNEGGAVIIVVPNLDGIKPTQEVVYESSAGPITGHDMYYGFSPALKDNPYMAHHTGFVPDTLKSVMEEAGFNVGIVPDTSFNLVGIGT